MIIELFEEHVVEDLGGVRKIRFYRPKREYGEFPPCFEGEFPLKLELVARRPPRLAAWMGLHKDAVKKAGERDELDVYVCRCQDDECVFIRPEDRPKLEALRLDFEAWAFGTRKGKRI